MTTAVAPFDSAAANSPLQPTTVPVNAYAERRAAISVRTLVTAALIVLTLVGLALFLGSVSSSVLIVLMAIVFAEGIRPLVAALSRRGVPQALGIIVVYLALLGALAGLVVLLAGPIAAQSASLARNLPQYQKHLTDLMQSLQTRFHINVNVGSQIGALLGGAAKALVGVGGTVVAVVVNFFLVLVIGFMWLLGSAGLRGFVVDLLPKPQQAGASSVITEIGFRMGGYLRGAAINGVVVGVATGLLSLLFGLPAPALIGAFAAVIALVPVVGAVLGVVVPALVALTISPTHALLVGVVMAVMQVIDANTVVPTVMNRVVALPALAVVLALLVGGALAGVIGALLAIPLAAAAQVVILRVLVPALHRAQAQTGSAT